MRKDGLLQTEQGEDDKRQQVLRLTALAHEIRPQLERVWGALPKVHEEITDESGVQIPHAFAAVLESLERRSFKERLQSMMSKHDGL